jgi:hypothetical protein
MAGVEFQFWADLCRVGAENNSGEANARQARRREKVLDESKALN